MMSGKLWKHSRPSACLLYHVQLPSTALARSSSCVLLVQRRWQSHDLYGLAAEQPAPQTPANEPTRHFGRAGPRSSIGPVSLGATLSGREIRSQAAWGAKLPSADLAHTRNANLPSAVLGPPRNTPFESPSIGQRAPAASQESPPPAQTAAGRLAGNLTGGAAARGPSSNPVFGSGRTPSNPVFGSAQTSPNQASRPSRASSNPVFGSAQTSPNQAARPSRASPNPAFGSGQKSANPAFGQKSETRPGDASGWGKLNTRRRHPPAPHPHQISSAPRRKPDQDFWSDLESRVGPQEKASGRQRGGREAPKGNWDWASDRQGPRRETQFDDIGRPQKRRQQQQARQPDRQQQRQGHPSEDGSLQNTIAPADVAVPMVEVADYMANEFASPWEQQEQHRRARRERAAERERKLSKAKSRRRGSSRSRYEDEDEDDDDYSDRAEERRQRKEEKKRRKELELAAAERGPVPILLPGFISVGNLGTALRIKPHNFLRQLAELGFEDITIESIMTGETAALIAQEYGYSPTVDSGETVDLKARPPPEDPAMLPARPPIVTIMGHVDHGKTTMLDWLRKSSVAAQEHGGITQHIGAFSVKLSTGKQITFLDTPGHAAFLTMRQRGANVTDIVILVVAADDSVKPQTLEALKHARAAKVPIIVAINKIDKDEARPDQVKNDLARNGVEIEDYGGDVQVVCVSGRTGQGMDDLEENILTLSEILDVRAEPDGMAEGWVLESSVKPVGRSASVLVKRGTLRRGDIVVAGTTWARIRSMRNEAGVEVDEAPPATPVEILGWKELPDAGDEVLQAPNEARAKEATEYREELADRETAASEFEAQERREREQALVAAAAEAEAAALAAAAEEEAAEGKGKTPKIRESSTGVAAAAGAAEETGGPMMVNFTVKGDVMGSVEAVCAAIQEIGSHEVRPRVLRSAPGPVSEFDVEHAAATGAAVINFNTPVPGSILRKAEEAGVAILDHTVIYHLIDAVKDRLSDRLAPLVTSRVLGEAEVLQVFPINVKGRQHKNIAGCRVRNGLVTRGARYRVFRNGEKVFDGKLESLRQGKKDTPEMRKGNECGIAFDEWQDMRVGDTVQAYEEISEKRKL